MEQKHFEKLNAQPLPTDEEIQAMAEKEYPKEVNPFNEYFAKNNRQKFIHGFKSALAMFTKPTPPSK